MRGSVQVGSAVAIQDPHTDPWRVTNTTQPTRALTLATLTATWALGALGPAAAVWPHGSNGRIGAVTLAIATIALIATLEITPRWWLPYATFPLATALTAAATHPTIGATPVLITATATALAHTALRGGPPTPATALTAPLAIPLIAAAQLHWYRSTDLTSTLALLASAAAIAALYHLTPTPLTRADHALTHTIRRLAAAIAATGLLIVALPTLYLPGAAANLIDHRPHRRTRRWQRRSTHLNEQRRDSHHPFTTTEPAARRRQLLAGLAIAAVAATALTTTLSARPPTTITQPIDTNGNTIPPTTTPSTTDDRRPYSERPAGRGLDWVDEALAEQSRVPLPPDAVGGYRVSDFESRYTNVVDGERRTLQPAPCDCDPLDIWLVGGSAVFGVGQRDDHTIASELVRAADAQGLHLHVRNLGVPGWTLWQEYQGILARLAAGETPPDLIIFHDGFNDMSQAYVQTLSGDASWSDPVVFDAAALEQLGRGTWDDIPERLDAEGGAAALGEKAVDRYLALRDVVIAQLAAEGIPTATFFQPDALATPRQREAAMQAYSAPGRRLANLAALIDGLNTALSRLPAEGNLRGLFDDDPTPVFLDLAHTNEEGARTVAEALLDQLSPRLERAAGLGR